MPSASLIHTAATPRSDLCLEMPRHSHEALFRFSFFVASFANSVSACDHFGPMYWMPVTSSGRPAATARNSGVERKSSPDFAAANASFRSDSSEARTNHLSVVAIAGEQYLVSLTVIRNVFAPSMAG